MGLAHGSSQASARSQWLSSAGVMTRPTPEYDFLTNPTPGVVQQRYFQRVVSDNTTRSDCRPV
jgi:hypothetical protein